MTLFDDSGLVCHGEMEHQVNDRVGAHTRGRKGTDWPALFAYRVIDGDEMTLEAIGEIACVTREMIRQIEASALRKLKRNAAALRLAREWMRT